MSERRPEGGTIKHTRGGTPADRAVGGRLRAARKYRNVTAVAMAERLGMSPDGLREIEYGRNRVPVVLVLWYAKLLRVPINMLLDDIV